MNDTAPKLADVSRFLLFKDLPQEQLDTVRRLLRERRFAPGEYLMRIDAWDERVYFLISGVVRITVDDEEGQGVILGFCGPGEVLGEISLVDNQGHSANVLAEQETAVLCMEGRDFKSCLDTMPRMSRNLSEFLCGRIRRDTKRIRSLATDPVPARLASLLHGYALRFGVPHPSGSSRIPLPLTQDTLAGMVGAARESVNRALRELKGSGIVSIASDYQIHVHDLDRLAACAQSRPNTKR